MGGRSMYSCGRAVLDLFMKMDEIKQLGYDRRSISVPEIH